MDRETVWKVGTKLIDNLQKRYIFMLRDVQVLVQNDYGYTHEQKVSEANARLEYLKQTQTLLNAEIDEYRKTIEKYRDA